MVYIVLGNSEKTIGPMWGWNGAWKRVSAPLSKISRYLEIRIHSDKLYQSTEKSEHHFPCDADWGTEYNWNRSFLRQTFFICWQKNRLKSRYSTKDMLKSIDVWATWLIKRKWMVSPFRNFYSIIWLGFYRSTGKRFFF